MKELKKMNQKITPYTVIPTELIIKDKNRNYTTVFDIFHHIGKKVYLGLSIIYIYFYATHKKFCSYNYNNSFWIEERRICNDTKINQSTVSIYIKIFEELKLLKVIRRGSSKDARSNVYNLTEPTQANLNRSMEIAKVISNQIKTAGGLRNYLESNRRKNNIPNKSQDELYSNNLREKNRNVVKDAKRRIYKALGKNILFKTI